jgi:hypothetical protein
LVITKKDQFHLKNKLSTQLNLLFKSFQPVHDVIVTSCKAKEGKIALLSAIEALLN